MMLTVLFPFDTSIPTEFIVVPPINDFSQLAVHRFPIADSICCGDANARFNLPNRTLQQEDG
jgi:hypothetical protein